MRQRHDMGLHTAIRRAVAACAHAGAFTPEKAADIEAMRQSRLGVASVEKRAA
jgi:hypothetical protein